MAILALADHAPTILPDCCSCEAGRRIKVMMALLSEVTHLDTNSRISRKDARLLAHLARRAFAVGSGSER